MYEILGKMRKIFIVLIIFSFANQLFAKTYYVSFSEGDDLNNGLSPAKPFKTTSRIEWMTKTGDDRILFKRGDSWLDEDYPVYFRGPTITNTKLDYYGAYGEGEKPVLGRICLANNLILCGLHIKYDGGEGTPFKVVVNESSNIVIQDCLLEGNNDGNTIQITCSKNITVTNCIITGGNDAAVSIANSKDIIVQNSYLSGYYNGIIIFKSHSKHECYNNLIRNNTCLSLASGGGAAIELGWGGIKENIVYGNICYGNNYGLFLSGHNNIVFNNIICDLAPYTLTVGIRLTGHRDPKWQKNWDCHDNDIYNNTIVTTGIALNIDGNYPGVHRNRFMNNIFYSSGKALLWVRDNGSDNLRDSLRMNYNCWYHPSGDFKIRWGYPKYMDHTFEEYRAFSRQGSKSIFADPRFRENYKLMPGSKCIGSGVKLDEFSFDFSGCKRKDSWDIGAYSFER